MVENGAIIRCKIYAEVRSLFLIHGLLPLLFEFDACGNWINGYPLTH